MEPTDDESKVAMEGVYARWEMGDEDEDDGGYEDWLDKHWRGWDDGWEDWREDA